MRSDKIKKGFERAPHRSLLKALGMTDNEIKKPFIGICSSANDIIPGHIHLKKIEDAVKAGIYSAGGTPMLFSTIGICDGLAMDHDGMYYSLPSRELIADSAEIVGNATPFDGMVFISSCDKITPGMLIAMGRLNIPSIFVSGGPMLAGQYRGEKISLVSVFEAVGRYKRGEIDKEELSELENSACPGAGACSGLFTANSMNSISEALGVSLKGNGTIPAVDSARIRLAKESGIKVMELVKHDLKPRDLVNRDSIFNAVLLDLALGGSTNTVLHLQAIAHSFDIKLSQDLFDSLSKKVPQLCSLSPVGKHYIEDLNRAGGVYSILNILNSRSLLKSEAFTVYRKPIGKLLSDNPVRDTNIIRPFDSPFKKEGGIAIIYGNLAKEGSVVKQAGIPENLKKHTGRAVVFEDGESATKSILNGNIKKGDVVVIRNEGPKGGPGMREMLSPTSALVGMNLLSEVVLITDGRFSGGSTGAVIGHISPEAAHEGMISIVEKGDLIEFDLKKRELNLLISEDEMRKRVKKWKSLNKEIKTSVLKDYAERVLSASEGAVFRRNNG